MHIVNRPKSKLKIHNLVFFLLIRVFLEPWRRVDFLGPIPQMEQSYSADYQYLILRDIDVARLRCPFFMTGGEKLRS